MKIRVIIYSKDISYVGHLSNYLNIHHNETLELSVFNEKKAFDEYRMNYKADILLLDEDAPPIEEEDAVIVRLKENPDEEDNRNIIAKYQKGELIYKTILNIYASGASKWRQSRERDGKEAVRISVFLPLNGGAGASTVSRAYVKKLTEKKKTLYLNLEVFGDCEKIWKAEGNFTLDDILYALKSRKGNLSLKLESILKKSSDGVNYYAPSTNPINLLELTEEEFGQLLIELKDCGLFEEIVLDMDIFPSPWMQCSLKEADQIWLVADGTDAAEVKYNRFLLFLRTWEMKQKIRILPKTRIFYNKFSSRTGKQIQGCECKIAGGSPRYEGIDEGTVIKKMAESDVFQDDWF